MFNPSGMPWIRRAVNRWMSRRISNLVGLELPDSQCGFRLMHLPSWAALDVRAARFEIESEMLFQFARAGHAIEFVPIRSVYAGEASRISPVRDAVRWFRWLAESKRQLRNSDLMSVTK